MDKYEYKLKLDQMKAFTAENNYKAAAEIADTINWHKIKNVNALIKAGEIYENVGRYEESRDILLMAYDRSPIGRMIIYRLELRGSERLLSGIRGDRPARQSQIRSALRDQ